MKTSGWVIEAPDANKAWVEALIRATGWTTLRNAQRSDDARTI
jgi:hypothetical protein